MKEEDIISRQSATCSSICRQIIFALGALLWSIVYSDLINKSVRIFPIIILLQIIVYLSIDISQYLYSYIKMRQLIYVLNKAKFHPDYSESDRTKMHAFYLKMRFNVERNSYILFSVKICFLPFILLSIICFFIFLI